MADHSNLPVMRNQLLDWQRFFRTEVHLLRRDPTLLFQQAANQPDVTAPAQAADRRFEAGLVTRAWLRWVNKPGRASDCLFTLAGHAGEVHDCAVSPDGTRILSAGHDGTLKRWDTATGAELHTVVVDEAPVTTCAAANDEEAYCWGGNNHGQLGDGTTYKWHFPIQVTGRFRFDVLSAGVAHTCAAANDEEAYCWGGNNHGQLGDGTSTDRTTPVPVAW